MATQPLNRMYMNPGSQQPWIQVSSLGSQDPKFQAFAQTPGNRVLYNPKFPAPTVHPSLSSFAQMVGPNFAETMSRDPQMQASLFDIDNIVKSNGGLYRKKEDGLSEFGTDAAGQMLYANPDLVNAGDNFKIGENQITMTGQVIDALGAFKEKGEAENFTNYAKLAGSPQFQGQVTAQLTEGDKTGAINNILTQLGKPKLDHYNKNPNDKNSATAFAAAGLVENWDKLNGAQRSMAIAGLAINGYEYADGKKLGERVLIQGTDAKSPSLTVGQALGLASTGVNVMAVMKNWDQLDAVQRLTFGVGTVSQMAVTAKQMGLIGPAQNAGKAVQASASALGAAGFKAIPSVGVGAIIGPASNVPAGYSVVSAGTAPNTVIAVPKGHEGTTATMNGAATSTTLNTALGGATAGLGAFQVYSNWGEGGTEGAVNGVVGGTVMAQGLNQLGQNNPYMLGAIVALSAMGGVVGKGTASDVAKVGTAGVAGYAAYQGLSGTAGAGSAAAASNAGVLGAAAAGAVGAYGVSKAIGSDMSDQQKGKAVRDAAGSAVASYFTLGLSSVAQYADAELLDGKIQKGINKVEEYIPGMAAVDKLSGKILSPLSGGTQNKEHMGRNQFRKNLVDAGIFDEDYNVTLANGTKAYVGLDGSDGKHEFTDVSKVPAGNEIRSLSDYDVDYTNDLDFSANLMTLSLMRLLAGGKGTAIDQVASQLANASIKEIGYGQELTERNFGVAQANARGFFHQSGIKAKEDGYALANQAFAEQRITEMDLMQIQQGLNMAFDEKGFDTAQQLMGGRHKGIAVAHEVNPVGPTMNFSEVPRAKPLPISLPATAANTQEVGAAMTLATEDPLYDFQSQGGNYWGQPTAGLFGDALQEYKDPWVQSVPGMNLKTTAPNTKDMSKEELKRFNASRYS